MKKHLFLILAVVIMAMFLTSCEKLQLATTEVIKTSNDGLFLKSAAVGEITSVGYFKDGKIDQFSYPANLLFEVKKEEAKALNSMLVVKGFGILSSGEAMFLVAKWDSKPVVLGTTPDGKTLYDINAQNVYASKLPFSIEDFGLQSATGTAKFNGLLKAENYIFAVKDGQVMIYDLTSSRGKIITAQGSIQNDALTFKVGAENWVLKFISLSPIGNIFEFSGGGKTFICYTLS